MSIQINKHTFFMTAVGFIKFISVLSRLLGLLIKWIIIIYIYYVLIVPKIIINLVCLKSCLT